MTDKKFYAGIGSRETPLPIQQKMFELGKVLAQSGWILRSGGAQGADTAFEKGCDSVNKDLKEIFKADDAEEWAFEEVLKFIPANRPPFHTWKPYTQALVARDMMQVKGRHQEALVKFVACWTLANLNDGGGTGYAMRCGDYYNIPIFNFQEEGVIENLMDFLEQHAWGEMAHRTMMRWMKDNPW